MKGFYYVTLFIATVVLFFSCNNMGNTNDHRPIVLGDSSTIVSEPDSQYRRDFVTDLTPAEPQPEEAKKDTVRLPRLPHNRRLPQHCSRKAHTSTGSKPRQAMALP